MSEYDDLAAKWESLRWRLIPKPGGAVTKPDDWYKLWAAVQQVTTGDVPGEKPLWAKTGGLDFDGRDRWEAHKSLKGQSTDCLLYTSPSPRDATLSRMPSSA